MRNYGTNLLWTDTWKVEGENHEKIGNNVDLRTNVN